MRDRSDLLVWLQRSYVARAFGDYDPLALREDDKPYDLDHISPGSTVAGWGERKFSSVITQGDLIATAFRDHRGTVTNGIGNYSVLELGRNRADGDRSINEKLFVDGQPDAQLWADFVLHPDHALLRRAASGVGTEWPAPRIEGFQAAVEARVVDLYSRLWHDLDFRAWALEPAETGTPADATQEPCG